MSPNNPHPFTPDLAKLFAHDVRTCVHCGRPERAKVHNAQQIQLHTLTH